MYLFYHQLSLDLKPSILPSHRFSADSEFFAVSVDLKKAFGTVISLRAMELKARSFIGLFIPF